MSYHSDETESHEIDRKRGHYWKNINIWHISRIPMPLRIAFQTAWYFVQHYSAMASAITYYILYSMNLFHPGRIYILINSSLLYRINISFYTYTPRLNLSQWISDRPRQSVRHPSIIPFGASSSVPVWLSARARVFIYMHENQPDQLSNFQGHIAVISLDQPK